MEGTIKGILFTPRKGARMIRIQNTLKALQGAVGGNIETVYFTRGMCLICNEEGILLDLDPQTILGRKFFGNVLLVGTQGEEFTDVLEEEPMACEEWDE